MRVLCSSILLSFALVMALAPGIARAHDPGLSAATVVLDGHRIAATLRLNAEDVPRDAALEAEWLAQPFEISSAEGGFVMGAPRIVRTPSHLRIEQEGTRDGAHTLRVRSAIVERLPHGHRQYVRVVGPDGATIAEGVLDAGRPVLDIALPPAAFEAGHFLRLGFEHILEGWDHLLFLLVMLVSCRSWGAVVRIVTAFTLAHSLTLALSTLGDFRLPPSLVEPAIAATIVYAALRSLVGEMREQVGLTFVFGLVHGLGFAGQLAGLGLAGGGLETLWPLLGFNLGVELGQLLIAVLVVPLLGWLRRVPRLARIGSPVLAVGSAILGLVWLVDRLAVS